MSARAVSRSTDRAYVYYRETGRLRRLVYFETCEGENVPILQDLKWRALQEYLPDFRDLFVPDEEW